MLTGVVIYLQDRPLIQATVAVMICALACCTLNYFQPHKNRIVFWLNQISFVTTLLKFLCAIVLVNSNRKEAEAIGALMIGLDCFFFVASAVGSVVAVHLLYKKIRSIFKTKISPVQTKIEKAWDMKS